MRWLVLCLLCLLPAGLSAQTSETDRGFIQGLLEDALSGEGRSVQVLGFAGALSSTATIDTITVADTDGIWLTLSDVSMQWTRRALLDGVIEINEISVGTLDLPRLPVPAEGLPAPEARGAFALPELPVAITIAQMTIEQATLGASLFGEAAELALSGSLDLAAGAGTAQLEIERLDAGGALSLSGGYDNTSRQLALDLSLDEPADGIAANLLSLPGLPSVSMLVQGDAPIDEFEARIRLATDGRDRLTGSVTLDGAATGDTQAFTLDVGGDVAPVFLPEYREFLGPDVRLFAQGQRAEDGALELSDLRIVTQALSVTGQAALAPDGWPRRLALEGRISPPDGNRVLLPLPGPKTFVQRADLTARFDAAEGEAWQIVARSSGISQPDLAIRDLVLNGAGQIDRASQRVTGALDLRALGLGIDDPAIAAAVGPDLTGSLVFGWQPDAPLALSDINLAGADYGMTGRVDIDQRALLDVLVTPSVVLRADDLSRFAAISETPLRGAADLAIDGQLEPLTGVFDLNFDGSTQALAVGVDRLDPLLAGAGDLQVRLIRDESGFRAEGLALRTPAARIEGSARISTGASTAAIVAEVFQTALIQPGLTGASRVTVEAAQSGEVWQIGLRGGLPGDTQVRFDGTVTGDGTNRLEASGQLNADVGRLAVFSTLAGRTLSGGASLEAQGSGDLLSGAFSAQASGSTRSLGIAAPAIEPLLRGTTRFDLAVARNAAGTLEIDRLSIAGPGVSGSLQGQVAATQSALDFRLSVPNLGLVVPELPGAAAISGTAARNGGPWRVAASGTGPGGIDFRTDGTAARDGGRLDLGITGSVPLALVNARLREQSLAGTVRFDLSVNGPPALSSVSGQLSIQDARAAMPSQNIALRGISGTVQLAASRAQVSLGGSLSSGGRVQITGPISLLPPFQADLTADLQNAQLRDGTLYETTANGQVTVNGPLQGGARIAGQITLGTVELRVSNVGPSYAVLDGLVHRNPPADVLRTLQFAGLDKQSAEAGSAMPAYPIDLTVNAPNRIFVRGRGLDAELGGTLRLTGTSDNIVPVGQFDLIRGRLDLLGRRLDLTEGSVSLRGSFDPVLNFAASSTVEDIDITLRLQGLASAPELIVTSTPELPQDEVLSLFLFGRDVTTISPLQAVQLASAIRTLSGRGGLGLTEQFRKGLGVDDLDIGTDDDGNTQARVGKYISDKVYTDVTVNSQGSSQINLNLDVSPNVTVRGRLGSDGDSGVGVFFEKDY